MIDELEPDREEYPTVEELEKIEKYDFLTRSLDQLLYTIHDLWKYAACGFVLRKKRSYAKLELHTFGWSGNEDIIRALEKNDMFFMCFWQKSVRGGHFYFEIPNKYFEWSLKRKKKGDSDGVVY